jgi:hypothetical protein
MEICFTMGGKKHCFIIPIFVIPIEIPKPVPPVNFPWLVSDAVILASLQASAKKIADEKVREAAERGFSGAMEALQKRIGSEVTIRTVQGRSA